MAKKKQGRKVVGEPKPEKEVTPKSKPGVAAGTEAVETGKVVGKGKRAAAAAAPPAGAPAATTARIRRLGGGKKTAAVKTVKRGSTRRPAAGVVSGEAEAEAGAGAPAEAPGVGEKTASAAAAAAAKKAAPKRLRSRTVQTGVEGASSGRIGRLVSKAVAAFGKPDTLPVSPDSAQDFLKTIRVVPQDSSLPRKLLFEISRKMSLVPKDKAEDVIRETARSLIKTSRSAKGKNPVAFIANFFDVSDVSAAAGVEAEAVAGAAPSLVSRLLTGVRKNLGVPLLLGGGALVAKQLVDRAASSDELAELEGLRRNLPSVEDLVASYMLKELRISNRLKTAGDAGTGSVPGELLTADQTDGLLTSVSVPPSLGFPVR